MGSDRAATLAVTRVPGGAPAPRHLVMLHGIYGRGRNWQGIARALVAAMPEYACWLIDLPYHGDSGAGTHGEGVRGIAADVAAWATAVGVTPAAVLGHSYGGKITLALAGRPEVAAQQYWIVESTPEAKPPSGSAWDMLQLVRRLPAEFASRDQAVEGIVRGGFTLGVAQWMATNLAREGDRFVWRLDFDVMSRLLDDFFATDLWGVVDSPPAGSELHFVRASRGSAMSEAAAARLGGRGGRRVHLHVEDGGHWIHAEAPDRIVALLRSHLPGT